MAIDTSPKSMSTGHGVTHLWQTVQWSATSLELVPVPQRHAAARLLLVQERLDQQRGGEDLVARAVQQVGARHVRGAHRLALAAAQAVLDRIGDRADVGLLHDQRLVAHQAEARRVGVGAGRRGSDASRSSLPLLKRPSRVDALLVGAEVGRSPASVRNSSLVMPMPCSPEITPSSAARQRHDARHRVVRLLQHLVVVGVDRDVGVHVAVAGVHVQRDEHAAAQHLLVDAPALRRGSARTRAPSKICCSGARTCVFHDTRSVWSCSAVEERCAPARRRVSIGGAAATSQARACQPDHSARTSPPAAPARAPTRSPSSSADGMSSRVLALAQRQRPPAKKRLERVEQRELVARCDSSMLMRSMPSRVLAQALQRNHHVLVDLERVGVLGDGGGARAVEPELLARLGADGDEAFAARARWPCAPLREAARATASSSSPTMSPNSTIFGQAAALALGGVADRAQVALVQVLEAGQDRAVGQLGLREHEVLDLDDGGTASLRRCRRTRGRRCARAPASCAGPSARW